MLANVFLEISQWHIKSDWCLSGWFKKGPWKEFRSSRRLKVNSNYDKGKLNGLWEWFHDNGNIRERGFYKLGIGLVSGKALIVLVAIRNLLAKKNRLGLNFFPYYFCD